VEWGEGDIVGRVVRVVAMRAGGVLGSDAWVGFLLGLWGGVGPEGVERRVGVDEGAACWAGMSVWSGRHGGAALAGGGLWVLEGRDGLDRVLRWGAGRRRRR